MEKKMDDETVIVFQQRFIIGSSPYRSIFRLPWDFISLCFGLAVCVSLGGKV